MPNADAFESTFAALRAILSPYAKRLLVTADGPGEYQLCSQTMKDRVGRPLFAAGVQIRKSYGSYSLMPVYAAPGLLDGLSQELKKRMQGKACFNFTVIEPAQVKELAALTKAGLAAFEHLKLPWAKASTKGARAGAAGRRQGRAR
jgi:hypothetical protein